MSGSAPEGGGAAKGDDPGAWDVAKLCWSGVPGAAPRPSDGASGDGASGDGASGGGGGGGGGGGLGASLGAVGRSAVGGVLLRAGVAPGRSGWRRQGKHRCQFAAEQVVKRIGYSARIGETNLGFLRMHIDVDQLHGDVEIDHTAGVTPAFQYTAVGLGDGVK